MAFLAFGVLIGSLLNRGKAAADYQSNYSKLQDVISIIDQQYVDGVKSDSLFEQTIADMLHKLDPHSNYIPAKDLQVVNEQIEGKFGGIGVRFALIRDTICVTNVVPNSPSFQVGIKAGDKIIRVNKKTVVGKKITNDKVMGLLKGDPMTAVNVTVYRRKQQLEKTIQRNLIPIGSISCAELIQDNIGYIRLDQFSVTSAIEFNNAATKLLRQGMKKLIFDLRDNGGGVLSVAEQIADQFLPAGRKIVEIRGKNQPTKLSRATAAGLLENIPVVVIINENSASASEILAGALQDNDRALLVGRRSFGKGLVQQDFALKDRSNLRLTIARYYMPSGRCIQKPFDAGYEAYYKDQFDREAAGEFFKPDSLRFKNCKKFKTVKGRTVMDASGISPDYFIPLDTSNSTVYYINLRYSPVFQHFAFDFVANKRGKWATIQAFNAQFEPSNAMIQQLAMYAQKTFAIPIMSDQLAQSNALIKRALKAEIARQLFIEDGYFFVLSASDNEIKKAIQLLK
jgi:carboxyl-terminal processing protease